MKTLLVVEDEKMIRKGICSMAQRSGVPIDEIIECQNGEEALKILNSRHIDAMFTDVRMPKMDGITLVKEVQKMDAKPLIAVISGYDDFEYVVEMLHNGVFEYTLKPVDRDKISEILFKFQKHLTDEANEEKRLKKMAFQQLQYMLFYDRITDVEVENICSMVHQYIPLQDFCIFCFASEDGDEEYFTEENKYYYVKGAEDHLDIIISAIKYKEELKGKLGGYYIGISGGYHNFMDLKQAFCEAAQMRRVAFETCSEVVDADNYKGVEKEDEYGVRVMMQTANLICSNNLEEALVQLQNFVDGVKKQKYSINDFYEQMEIIITTTMKVYKKSLENKEEEVNELLDIYSFQTIDDYMAVVTEWIRHFDELISDDIDNRGQNFKMQKAIDYIHENYMTDLNMAVVSNYISMNYSLFSFTFKQYTGTNFVNYLKDIRVGEAKKLLTQTDLKVNEIAEKVGYEHEKHFMKTFKKITGLTPTQYRNNFRNYDE